MDKDQEIKMLKEEIKQLKYALVAVYEECSNETPSYMSNRISIKKESYIRSELDINSIVAGDL